MLRRIVDYSKLQGEALSILKEKYPDKIPSDEIFSIQNSAGEYLRVLELKGENSTYLVKIAQRGVSALTAESFF